MTATSDPPADGSTADNGARWLARLLADDGEIDHHLIDLARIPAEWHEPVQLVLETAGGKQARKAVFSGWCETRPAGARYMGAVLALRPTDDPTVMEPVEGRFRLWTAGELENRPAPEYLIENHIIAGSLAALTGVPATYKSFTALDMAMSIAAGIAWHGFPTNLSPVVYVSGEGSGGLSARLRAWRLARGATPSDDNFRVITQAVQLLDDRDVDALIADVRRLPLAPALIVIGTLARSLVGGDENSARDMGQAIANCDRIRQAIGATVLLVHHHSKAGSIRGSTALPGALDTIMTAERPANSKEIVILKCEKQKDADGFADITLAREVVTLGDGTTSLVFNRTDRKTADDLAGTSLAVLKLLTENFGPEGATATTWQGLADDAAIPPRSYYRAKKELQEAGKVVSHGGGKNGRGARWRAV